MARPQKPKSPPELNLGNRRLATALRAKELKIQCVAGLDTAANRFHLYCNNGYQAHHTIKVNSKGEPGPDERRHTLYSQAQLVFWSLPHGTIIIAEEPLALRNGKTTRLLGLAAGAIWAAHLDCAVFWAWADVAAWKKSVIGSGNANKDEIAAWVKEHMRLEFPEDEVDYYDAAALSYYGQQMLGLIDQGASQ